MFSRQEVLHRRRRLRNYPTEAERRLWFVLRKRSLCGLKFRRQESLGKYIVDFYCPARRLAIEVDGLQHYTREGAEYDRKRTEYLSTHGISVVRVTNADVYWRIESVIAYLTNVINGTSVRERQ